MEVSDPKREEKVLGLAWFLCNQTIYFFQANGEYMVTFESSLLQEFCFSLRVFDMQKADDATPVLISNFCTLG